MQGLGVGTFEPFDEFLGFGNELLLVVVGFLLLFTAFLAEFQVFGIVYFIIVYPAHGHFDGTGGDVVHELAVVADDDDSLSVADKKIFQPLYGFYVQMVGRLVQQQYVGLLQQQFGKLDAHAPSTAEVTGLAVEVFAYEPQSEQCFFHILLVIGGVDGIELFAQGGDVLDKFHVTVAFVVGTRFQFLVEALYLGFHFMQVGKGLCCFLEYGTAVFRHKVLRKVSYDTVFGG